ncbi:hypothetical protein BAUCODRAFT_24566 [Baudoinia panamericana UAMH 10762]|uniref:Zn(2)-C6 fungal-type domain-containing protein n=1 Tax=Baudoinia panamericana (strain UAMH 10762) TaxID=717646 RepID=M2MZ33_BAUPA|nr:uncharacterized protein BAUCODRAFT_24566 [Baudoinia panamericana UAMH 10762]EMC96873.1 hypothetical protein BAUCODRAFT_24566 [Baudoinia panamericana UAMH 10762]
MQPQRRKIVSRACDACRRRRVRCDAALPTCSSCIATGDACSFGLPSKKRGPRRRPRTVLSPVESITLFASHAQQTSLAGVSPGSDASVARSASGTIPAHGTICTNICDDLWRELTIIWGSNHIVEHFNTCVDLYMRHLFPITPLVSEGLLRLVASKLDLASLSSGSHEGTAFLVSPENPNPGSSILFSNLARTSEVVEMSCGILSAERALALLTAAGAKVASHVPRHLLPAGLRDAAECLLAASRRMLHSIQDPDIDRPCATSVIIRYFHSCCVHAAGHLRLAWYILGEAIRMAQDLRVYDETSMAGLSPMESHLRRSVFWQLNTGDKSAAILNGRPFAFSSSNLEQPFNVLPLPLDHNSLLDSRGYHDPARIACHINTGFNLIARIFDCACVVLSKLRSLGDYNENPIEPVGVSQVQRASITGSLGVFHSLTDEMPEWIVRPWQSTSPNMGTEDIDYIQHYHWIQHANVMLTYHCLHLIIVVEAAKLGHADMLGYSQEPQLLALHKLELARHAISILRTAPFEALQINAEPCV